VDNCIGSCLLMSSFHFLRTRCGRYLMVMCWMVFYFVFFNFLEEKLDELDRDMEGL
jgi:hypothetical protein